MGLADFGRCSGRTQQLYSSCLYLTLLCTLLCSRLARLQATSRQTTGDCDSASLRKKGVSLLHHTLRAPPAHRPVGHLQLAYFESLIATAALRLRLFLHNLQQQDWIPEPCTALQGRFLHSWTRFVRSIDVLPTQTISGLTVDPSLRHRQPWHTKSKTIPALHEVACFSCIVLAESDLKATYFSCIQV